MIKLVAKETRFYPKQSTEGSAGFDVFAREKIEVKPGEVGKIPLGIKLSMDKGEACFVMSRSSMPLKKNCLIPNGIGLIDSDYRGEINIEVFNFGKDLVVFEEGEKCAQLVFVNYHQDIVQYPFDGYDDRDNTFKTERGIGGFGSTGNK